MANKVSIIMYHYVRDLDQSRYPNIKGLSVELFKQQLQYLMKYYKIIKMEDLIEAIKSNKELSDNSLLLTFDDGYRDHFEFVFPLLIESGIQGSFFPSAQAIQGHRVLDVNKIHFILASLEDKEQLIKDIFSMLDEFREEYSLKETEYYFNKLAHKSRFDTKEVIFIKRILQRELPEKLRNIIVDKLFKKYVYFDEASFSRELYMNTDQIKCMKRCGMYIGSHGFDHFWLSKLPIEKQEKEIKLSLKFLEKVGCDISEWVMCYPYGSYNDSLITLLKEKGCILGLTTNVEIADLNKDDVFTLPRLDTNDLPKDKNAKPNEWTLRVRRVY